MRYYSEPKARDYESPMTESLVVRTDSAFLLVSGGEPESVKEDDVDLDFGY